MDTNNFMDLSMNEKLKTVNKMLAKEDKEHLKNVSQRLSIPYSAFTKIMRDNGNYQYNQTSKRYEKLMDLTEYELYIGLKKGHNDSPNNTLHFLEEHLDELKQLLIIHKNQLILDPKVYDLACKTSSKSFQVNMNIYDQFTDLCSTRFPHLRQRDLVSQCLLDFVQKYGKTLSD